MLDFITYFENISSEKMTKIDTFAFGVSNPVPHGLMEVCRKS